MAQVVNSEHSVVAFLDGTVVSVALRVKDHLITRIHVVSDQGKPVQVKRALGQPR